MVKIFFRVYVTRFNTKMYTILNTCQYGILRPYSKPVICRYLDGGVLKNGFARVRCEDCGHEYLIGHSGKRRHFCPSLATRSTSIECPLPPRFPVTAVPVRFYHMNLPVLGDG